MNPVTTAKHKQTRSRWHISYFVLAAFDVFAVSTSLYFSHRITNSYHQSIAINQLWAHRRDRISELGLLASRVNAPGNNVFDSHNVPAESSRMQLALSKFNQEIKAIQAELLLNDRTDLSQPILADLKVVNQRMAEMLREAELIFSYFQRSLPNEAGKRMATMDQKYANLTVALHNLQTKVSQIQTQLLMEQSAASGFLQRLEVFIAVLILLMVAGTVFYGHKISRQMRSHDQEIQHYIQQLHQTQSQLIQAEKMSSLGQLVAGIAHEINNPVNFVHGNLNHTCEYIQDLLGVLNCYQMEYSQPSLRLQEKVADIDLEFIKEDFPKLLNSMQIGTERIRDIVLSLRNFSRLDESEVKLVDLHEGIDSTLMILQHRLKATSKRLEIKVIKDYGQLPLVGCYPGLLNQVFMNLLTNAIDVLEESYSKQNVVKRPDKLISSNSTDAEPTIWIRTKKLAGDRVTIHIVDNGAGISAAAQAKLFDPFFTTKPVGKGTGLGLSISYQIVVEQHGGSLQCLSTLGHGAEFIIQIPLHQKANQAQPDTLICSQNSVLC